jgi:hypothetical protein
MLALSLLWLGLGLCLALLMCIARPAHYAIRSRPLFLLFLSLASMLVALATGWLGTWMYGRVAATVCVVWVVPLCLWLLFRFLRLLRA